MSSQVVRGPSQVLRRLRDLKLAHQGHGVVGLDGGLAAIEIGREGKEAAFGVAVCHVLVVLNESPPFLDQSRPGPLPEGGSAR